MGGVAAVVGEGTPPGLGCAWSKTASNSVIYSPEEKWDLIPSQQGHLNFAVEALSRLARMTSRLKGRPMHMVAKARCHTLSFIIGNAKVAELADAPDLGSGTERCGGSSPPFRTMKSEQLAVSGVQFVDVRSGEQNPKDEMCSLVPIYCSLLTAHCLLLL